MLREANHSLYEYVTEHFSTEEEYMKKYNYPKLEAHKAEHVNFMDFYSEFQKIKD